MVQTFSVGLPMEVLVFSGRVLRRTVTFWLPFPAGYWTSLRRAASALKACSASSLTRWPRYRTWGSGWKLKCNQPQHAGQVQEVKQGGSHGSQLQDSQQVQEVQ